MSTAIVPFDVMQQMAAAVAKSGLFGVKTPDQALALMLIAQAEGLHPATAARDFHVIQGRPAMKADAMLARYLQSGGRVEWHEYTDAKVSATFSHPQGGTAKIDWTMDRAKQAGLAGKDNWRQYPRQMLKARVVSEGIRMTNPAVCVGVYTPEEVQDFAPEKDMGRAEVVDEKPKKRRGVEAFKDSAPADVSNWHDTDRPAASAPTPAPPSQEAEAGGVSGVQELIDMPDDLPFKSAKPAKVTKEQAKTLQTLCEEAKSNSDKLLERLGAMGWPDVNAADYAETVTYFEQRIAAKQQAA